ncbi:hypothetical protein FAGAP_8106 [Fusarium agapanthi]|uniref:Mid2 domain-containing protein n=1 Tax=Fusarium agapanthi TaxID=1803897 RepID=A0A9P5B6J0_9HYPO|nr:hypothetical protein FAGAP_8106 [Fusarium agapanthi]
MHTISILTLILSIFASHAVCSTRFLRPPEWNSDFDREDGFGNNIQYTVGDTIQLLWETDLDKVELYLVQRIGSTSWEERILDSSRTEWKAEWDVVGILEGGEDSVYNFVLGDRPDGLAISLSETQYFNVTAPRLGTTITTRLQTSTTIQSMSSSRVAMSATQSLSTSTATDQSSDSDVDPDSDSGLSKGEIAGAAVGGTIGGLIFVGAVGWLIWRWLGRNERNKDMSVASQGNQGQVNYSGTKAELPSDPVIELYPSGYARSPPGLHEAP